LGALIVSAIIPLMHQSPIASAPASRRLAARRYSAINNRLTKFNQIPIGLPLCFTNQFASILSKVAASRDFAMNAVAATSARQIIGPRISRSHLDCAAGNVDARDRQPDSAPPSSARRLKVSAKQLERGRLWLANGSRRGIRVEPPTTPSQPNTPRPHLQAMKAPDAERERRACP
jgi:hypothetical protein